MSNVDSVASATIEIIEGSIVADATTLVDDDRVPGVETPG